MSKNKTKEKNTENPSEKLNKDKTTFRSIENIKSKRKWKQVSTQLADPELEKEYEVEDGIIKFKI